MVILAVLLYCLVPSGCPIGHIVYLWTLTVAVLRFPRCVSILVAHHVMRDQFRYMLKIGKIES